MDIYDDDIVKFFACLNKNKVHYILVGGFAVNYHGFNRSTGDLDVWLADTEENRKPFVEALVDYGIEGSEIFHTLPFVAGYTEIVLDNGFVVDVMADLQFFKQDKFNACYAIAKEFKIADNVLIKVLHLNNLIEEKEKSHRPKDNIDAVELKKLYRI